MKVYAAFVSDLKHNFWVYLIRKHPTATMNWAKRWLAESGLESNKFYWYYLLLVNGAIGVCRLNRLFASTPKFLSTWASGGMSEDELRALELVLLADPKVGDVVPGTHGLRKVRVAAGGKGRRGGGRVLYKDFERFGQIFFLFFVRKGEQDDLTSDQRRAVARAVQAIEHEL